MPRQYLRVTIGSSSLVSVDAVDVDVDVDVRWGFAGRRGTWDASMTLLTAGLGVSASCCHK